MRATRLLPSLRQTSIASALLAFIGLLAPSLHAWQHELHEPGMDQTLLAPQSTKSASEEEASRQFSEFNHRFSGVFVFLAGILALLQPYVARRFSGIRYLWTVIFFIPGLYLLILSDPESWPTKNQTLYYVITENMQVLQHKIFSLILLALSVVEYLRIRGKLQAVWTAFLFPAFAAAGAALLFFHSPPGSGMDEAAHQTMMQIQHQHVQFGLVGFGIAITKAIADTERFHRRAMQIVFAVLMLILGLLLMNYTE